MRIEWAAVSARLSGSRIYWFAVVDRRGAPRTLPNWGVVVDDALHFYIDGGRAVALNLHHDPRVAINLEDGENVVLVRGTVECEGGPAEHPELVAAFAEKYDDHDDSRFPSANPEPDDRFYRLRPTWAMLSDDTQPAPSPRPGRYGCAYRDRIWEPEKPDVL